MHIVECYVLDSDQLISGTVYERVQHATWIVLAAWLVLLLGSDVDSPPEWLVNLDVVKENVRDFAT